MRYMQVRWGQGARMLGMKGRRCKHWWSGKGDGVGGVGVIEEELCEKVVEVWMVSDSVMTVVVEEDVLRFICGFAPQKEVWRKSSLFMMS